MQPSEDKDVPPDSDKEDDIMDKQHMMNEQYRLSAFCTVVHRFTKGPNGFQQNEAPHITKTLAHLTLSWSSSLQLCKWW